MSDDFQKGRVPEEDGVELDFVDALPLHLAAGRSAMWTKCFEQLKQRPGQWARLRFGIPRKALASVANHINKRHYRGMPSGIWRAATRGGQIYVCYCGEIKSESK